jgi:hypothetical protein
LCSNRSVPAPSSSTYTRPRREMQRMHSSYRRAKQMNCGSPISVIPTSPAPRSGTGRLRCQAFYPGRLSSAGRHGPSDCSTFDWNAITVIPSPRTTTDGAPGRKSDSSRRAKAEGSTASARAHASMLSVGTRPEAILHLGNCSV